MEVVCPQQPQGGSGGTGAAAGGPLDYLRSDARFQTLRQMVAQNPQILQPMLQELGKNNPDLLQQITENQQEFLRLLTEEPPPQVAEAAEGLMQLAGQGGLLNGIDIKLNSFLIADGFDVVKNSSVFLVPLAMML